MKLYCQVFHISNLKLNGKIQSHLSENNSFPFMSARSGSPSNLWNFPDSKENLKNEI